jgi:predicted transcriptional regulator
MEYFNEPEFQDPADWNIASYTAHPIDSIEPLPDHSTSYRDAALECLRILGSVDRFMSRARDSRLAWTAIASAIGLNSTAGLTEAEIGRQLGVSEQSVRRAMNKFTKLANLDPAGGLRALGQVRSNGGLCFNGKRGL